MTQSIRAQKWIAEVLINDHQSHFCICDNEEFTAQKYDELAARHGRLLNSPTSSDESCVAPYTRHGHVDIGGDGMWGVGGVGAGAAVVIRSPRAVVRRKRPALASSRQIRGKLFRIDNGHGRRF